MKLMILAAGKGSRLQPMTLHQHKACVSVLNVPVLCFGLYLFLKLPLKGIVANLCYLADQVEQTLGKYVSSLPYPLSFSDEREQIMGSGGALVKAKPLLENETKNFFTLNADTIFIPERKNFIEKMWERHLESKSLATLLCISGDRVDESFSKVWTTKTQFQVLSVGLESPEKSYDYYQDWHFTGIAIFSESIFQYLPTTGPSYLFKDALIPAIKQGQRVEVYKSSGLWLEMGRPGDLLFSTHHLMEIIQKQKEPYQNYLQKLLQTFAYQSKFRATKESILLYHKTCFISDKAHLKGKIVLGKNCSIGDDVYLEDCVLQGNCKLQKGVRIKNSLMSYQEKVSSENA